MAQGGARMRPCIFFLTIGIKNYQGVMQLFSTTVQELEIEVSNSGSLPEATYLANLSGARGARRNCPFSISSDDTLVRKRKPHGLTVVNLLIE